MAKHFCFEIFYYRYNCDNYVPRVVIRFLSSEINFFSDIDSIIFTQTQKYHKKKHENLVFVFVFLVHGRKHSRI